MPFMPSEYLKEGDAYDNDGSVNTYPCYFYGT